MTCCWATPPGLINRLYRHTVPGEGKVGRAIREIRNGDPGYVGGRRSEIFIIVELQIPGCDDDGIARLSDVSRGNGDRITPRIGSSLGEVEGKGVFSAERI